MVYISMAINLQVVAQHDLSISKWNKQELY